MENAQGKERKVCYNFHMNAQELMQRIGEISQAERFSFYENGNAVGSRFNMTDFYEQRNEGNFETNFSLRLYALVSQLVFYKAKGVEASRKGLESLRAFFQKGLLSCKEEEIRKNLKDEIEKALSRYEAFLGKEEPVTQAELFAKTYPILAVLFCLKDGVVSRKEFLALSKKKELLFRQASLYLRSLFQAFLTTAGIDAREIRQDVDNPLSPYFVYRKTLIVSTDKDSFSLSLLKEDLINNLKEISKNFSLKDVDSIGAVYLLRALFAVAKI